MCATRAVHQKRSIFGVDSFTGERVLVLGRLFVMANCVIYEDPRLVRGGAKCAQGGTVCTGGVVACPLKIQMMYGQSRLNYRVSTWHISDELRLEKKPYILNTNFPQFLQPLIKDPLQKNRGEYV